MLRNLGIRWKLLGLVAVPMVLLLAVSLVLVGGARSDAGKASDVASLARYGLRLNDVVQSMQEERAALSSYLYSDQDATRQLRAKTSGYNTDAAIDDLRANTKPAELALVKSVQRSGSSDILKLHDGVPELRKTAIGGGAGALGALKSYGDIIATDISVASDINKLTSDSQLTLAITRFVSLSNLIEATAEERDLLVRDFTRQLFSSSDYRDLATYIVSEQDARDEFTRAATPAQAKVLDDAVSSSDDAIESNKVLEQQRAEALRLLQGVKSGDVNAVEQATSLRLTPLGKLQSQVTGDLAKTADRVAGDARQQALSVGLLAGAGILVALLLVLLLTRRIVGPVRRLTSAATDLGDELPRMVERMQTPGEGPGVDPSPVKVESRDEIGQLALAFNAVNETTIRVAQEQAALRAGIAEMFVNVARRNQVLLGRQLSFIDELEHREENPDQLENLFRLDHLATRMRRNAESLLVLAGIDGSRRLRRPMALTDVIRTAASEIEQFERVDLATQIDPPVSGRFALTLAHLLAELLENSTHFSNPDTRVVVSAVFAESGAHVVITDNGLGMSEQEIEEANEKIKNPPVSEIAVAQRLGFFVVGRLSQRLGAEVSVRRGRSGGVIADLLLPADLFTTGSVPVKAAPELAAISGGDGGSADASEPAPAAPTEEQAAAEHVVTAQPIAAAKPVVDQQVVTEKVAPPVATVVDEIIKPATAPTSDGYSYVPAVRDVEEPVAAPEPVVAAPEPVVAEPVASAPEPVVAVPEPVVAEPVVAEPEPVATAPEPTPVPQPRTARPSVPQKASRPAQGPPETAGTHAEVAAELAAAQAPVRPAAPAAPAASPALLSSRAVDILPGGSRGRRGRQQSSPAKSRSKEAPAPVPTAPAPGSPALQPVGATALSATATTSTAPATAAPQQASPELPPALEAMRADAYQPDMADIAAGAQLASAALAELSQISQGYAPAIAQPEEGGLVRRTPKKVIADGADSLAAAAALASRGPARDRDAKEVRGMLSGFRAGVERGRTGSDNPTPSN